MLRVVLSKWSVCGAAALLVLWTAPTLRADSAQDYSLTLCENGQLAQNPTSAYFSQFSHQAGNAQLALQRSMPVFVLTNTSTDPNSAITSFNMTVGLTTDEFVWAQVVKTSSSTVQITSITPTVGGEATGEMTLTFSGLAPGAWVEFQAAIDPIANPTAINFEDYRQIFFNNGSNGSENSHVSVGYSGISGSILPHATMGQTLPDQPGITVPPVSNCGSSGEPVIPFTFTGVVPEPSSVVLLGFGLAALGALAWRRQQSTRPE